MQDKRGSFYSITPRTFAGGNSYFNVAKITLSGAVQWNVPYNPPGVDVIASAVAVDFEGSLVIAGTQQNDGGRDLLLVKFTPYGALDWQQAYHGKGSVTPTALTTDPRDGSIYSAGTVSESGNLQVVRYNRAGGFYWSNFYRRGRTNYARAIVVDRNNGDAHVTVITTTDPWSGYSRILDVLFTVDGAVVAPP